MSDRSRASIRSRTLSSCSPVSFQTTLADPIIKRVETVGKILPHVTAKIVDADGIIVPRGTPGEILVKGYLVQKGYDRPHSSRLCAVLNDED